MSNRYQTDPKDINEVEKLKSSYDIVLVQPGVYLLEEWLFIYPKHQKWGHRYEAAYGHYERGHLAEFVEKAVENHKFPKPYYGQIAPPKQ